MRLRQDAFLKMFWRGSLMVRSGQVSVNDLGIGCRTEYGNGEARLGCLG